LDVKLDLGKEPRRSAPPTDDERRIPSTSPRGMCWGFAAAVVSD